MDQFSDDTLAQIRSGRSKFISMAGTYGLGVFNDSFFRNSVILMAISGSHHGMEGWIMAVFTLPYILFASYVGWLADRFPKRNIVISSKALELVAMISGAIGICLGSWPLIFAMVFTMGLQSCIFNPALNGSIPELYPDVFVNRANARLKVIVTGMILAGVAASGPALDIGGQTWGISNGYLTVGIGAIAISFLGLVVSLFVPRRDAANPSLPFPTSGPLETLKELRRISKDHLLTTVLAVNVFIWFTGAMLILLIEAFALNQMGWTKSMGSYLVAAETIGVAIGGIIAGRVVHGDECCRLFRPCLIGLGISVGLIFAVPFLPENLRLATAFAILVVGGVFGGLCIVPSGAFIQVRPAPGRKGTVIATAGFVIFCGIFLSGPVEAALVYVLTPDYGFLLLALLSLLMVIWLNHRMKNSDSDDISVDGNSKLLDHGGIDHDQTA